MEYAANYVKVIEIDHKHPLLLQLCRSGIDLEAKDQKDTPLVEVKPVNVLFETDKAKQLSLFPRNMESNAIEHLLAPAVQVVSLA
jgi:hypothetical protein